MKEKTHTITIKLCFQCFFMLVFHCAKKNEIKKEKEIFSVIFFFVFLFTFQLFLFNFSNCRVRWNMCMKRSNIKAA